jgi:glycerol-3-phosphate dehydrogenase
LVLLNAQDAISKGAKIYTNANIQKVIRKKDNWEVFLNNGEILYSKVIINASGPYALDVLNNLIGIQSRKKIRHVQGSHIITEKLYKGEQAYILQLDDKRIIFLIPYLDKYTLIGTTDHEVKSYDNPKITDIEKKYLISSVNKFIKNKITEDNIIWTYSGVRPLVEDLNENASKITRDYTFEIDDKDAPILTVFGGKLTTFRKLSEHALDKISKYIKISNKSWTGNEILPGGEKTTDLNFLIPEGILPRLIKTYGHKITKLNQYYRGFNDGGEHIFNDLYEFEIKYLVLEEMAKTSEDILFRRTKLGINFPKEKLLNLENILKKYL